MSRRGDSSSGAGIQLARKKENPIFPIRKYPGLLHRIALIEDHERELLIADIQLFADSETPSYGVILGKLDKKDKACFQLPT